MLTQSLKTPITNIDGAKAWVAELVAQKMDFHLEDSPETIIKGVGGDRLFTDAEAAIVRARVTELYSFDWGTSECPIGYMLDITNEEWRAE